MVIFDTRACIVVVYSVSASKICYIVIEIPKFLSFYPILVLFGVKLNV